jgi:hypothetical protein
MKINKEPYISRVHELLAENHMGELRDGVLYFSWEEVYNLAKASGLRSKKTRHIVKRFKKIIHAALERLVEEHG